MQHRSPSPPDASHVCLSFSFSLSLSFCLAFPESVPLLGCTSSPSSPTKTSWVLGLHNATSFQSINPRYAMRPSWILPYYKTQQVRIRNNCNWISGINWLCTVQGRTFLCSDEGYVQLCENWIDVQLALFEKHVSHVSLKSPIRCYARHYILECIQHLLIGPRSHFTSATAPNNGTIRSSPGSILLSELTLHRIVFQPPQWTVLNTRNIETMSSSSISNLDSAQNAYLKWKDRISCLLRQYGNSRSTPSPWFSCAHYDLVISNL